MSISSKLIATLILALSLLVGVMYVLVQWSFDRGMLEYVNKKADIKLETLIKNLDSYYNYYDSWQGINDKPIRWAHILRVSGFEKSISKRELQYIDNPKFFDHYPLGRQAQNRKGSQQRRPENRQPRRDANRPGQHNTATNRQPPDFSANGEARYTNEQPQTVPAQNQQRPDATSLSAPHSASNTENMKRQSPPKYNANGQQRPPGLKPPKGKGPQNNGPNKPVQRPSLYDKNKKLINGPNPSGVRYLPIGDADNPHGFLGVMPRLQVTNDVDIGFVNEVNETFAYVSLGVLVITLMFSIPLSRIMTSPISKLARATNEVKQGNFDIKIKPRGRDELSKLARDFVDMAKSLETNESSRKKWLADVSHELRTPLAIFRGEIEAMIDGIRPMNNENLLSLQEEATHLQNLINDLHELASNDVGALRYHKTEVDLAELVELAVTRHNSTLTTQKISLHLTNTSDEAWVWGDPTRLNQIFDNLIKNSIKYTDEPGDIYLSISGESNKVYFIIEDTPPNVPDIALEHLFDHLFRVENSRNRKTGGSGLGLALCKRIVENHQGEIEAYHAKTGGLGIKFCLPRLV
ncbi:ATP-binding protein [Algibacillus agarilyticus]|uniref:ATP-binding protein n=1 Tax=Algibacillus agarilyticus TaxID=2234133 RepID=UPI000DD055DC|nr:ATP-binding protein [Algibacillus agarilyticus]